MQQALLHPDWPATEAIVFPSPFDVLFIRAMCSAAWPLQEYVPFWIINKYSFHYLVSHMIGEQKKVTFSTNPSLLINQVAFKVRWEKWCVHVNSSVHCWILLVGHKYGTGVSLGLWFIEQAGQERTVNSPILINPLAFWAFRSLYLSDPVNIVQTRLSMAGHKEWRVSFKGMSY